MALIKNKQADRLQSRAFTDLGDLKRQAEQVLEAARVEAGKILEQARAEAARLVEQAGPRGFAEGRETGMIEGREEGRRLGREATLAEFGPRLEHLTASWTEAVAALESRRNDMLLAAREDVLAFALAMGGKIARRVIDADPSVVKDQVAEALALVSEPTGVVVLINPQDRKLVESVLDELCERIGRSGHVELKDDPQVERGGCVIATGKGRIDATIDRQIERVVEALLPGTVTLRPFDDGEPS